MRFDAVAVHQVAHRAWRAHLPVVPKLVDLLIFLVFNSTIHHTTSIGRGTFAAHRGIALVINKGCVIGRDVHLGAQVVLGSRRGADGGPRIGDGAFIGAGAIVLGEISIGAGAVIGAGALVISDVPAGATIGGALGRQIASRYDASDEA